MALFGRRGRGAAALPEPLEPLAAHGITLPAEPEPLQAAADLTVWAVAVADGRSGLELWQAVRAVHPSTGLWPVLILENTWETTAAEVGEEPDPVEPLDVEAWLAAHTAERGEDFPRGEAAPFEVPDPSDWRERVAAWPDEPDRMLLVPAPGGWAVPGLLGWSGAVNHDIMGDVHTAFLRRWDAAWGADLVVLGFDTLTLRVSRPPATPDAALAVAGEVATYCEDIVFQGVQTLDALVPMVASSAWWFWWD